MRVLYVAIVAAVSARAQTTRPANHATTPADTVATPADGCRSGGAAECSGRESRGNRTYRLDPYVTATAVVAAGNRSSSSTGVTDSLDVRYGPEAEMDRPIGERGVFEGTLNG
jgi:hypothetical protein